MRRHVVVGSVAAVALAGFGAAIIAMSLTHADTRTPCEGAALLVNQVRDSISQGPETVAYRGPDSSFPAWSPLTGMARNIAAGSLEGVEGNPSPQLAAALQDFSRTLPIYPADLTDPAGEIQQSMARITAACS